MLWPAELPPNPGVLATQQFVRCGHSLRTCAQRDCRPQSGKSSLTRTALALEPSSLHSPRARAARPRRIFFAPASWLLAGSGNRIGSRYRRFSSRKSPGSLAAGLRPPPIRFREQETAQFGCGLGDLGVAGSQNFLATGDDFADQRFGAVGIAICPIRPSQIEARGERAGMIEAKCRVCAATVRSRSEIGRPVARVAIGIAR